MRADEEDQLDVVERLLVRSQDGDLHALAEAGRMLWRIGSEPSVDPRRSRLVFDVADRFLAFAERIGSDALDPALELVNRELVRIKDRSDEASAVHMVAMRGALRDESFHLKHTFDDLLGAVDDLTQATELLRHRPELMTESDRAWCWSVLGRAQLRLSDHIRDLDVAREAIAALEQADALSGRATWELRAGIRHSMATARIQYEERRLAQDDVSTSDLDRAIDLAVDDLSALAASGEAPGTDRAGWYQNIAVLMSRRIRRPGRTPTQRATDRETGLVAAAAGLGLLPTSDRGVVSLLAARADLTRLGESSSEAVEEALTAVFDAAVALTDPEIIVAGANLATHHAADARWSDVSVVGHKSQQVVESLVRRQPRDEYRWTLIRRAAGIAAVTAHALANQSRAAEAAVALERMQATALSDRYARPHQVHRLVSGLGHDELAAEYRRAVIAVRDTEQPDNVLRSAEARLAEVTRDIEKLPGTASLLRPVGERALAAATRDRTVVYLACGRYGGVAVVTHGDGSFRSHVLDDLTVAQVAPVATRFARRVVASANSPRLRSRTIRNTTEWLGRFILPRIERIIASDSAPVTVVPIGQLAGLPMHAARTQPAGMPRWALNHRRYTFSPSALMLRTPSSPLDRDASALVVADPARHETGNLHGAGGEAATVTAALAGVNVLHFACHGVAVIEDPMRSALLLADQDELHLAQLAATPMDGVDLAVLSACQTAVSDITLPGEALNLSVGILAAGARAVVGSLWPLPDAATAALMEIFYAKIADGRSPADALRDAQLALASDECRAPLAAAGEDWSDPYFWAGLVCLGQ